MMLLSCEDQRKDDEVNIMLFLHKKSNSLQFTNVYLFLETVISDNNLTSIVLLQSKKVHRNNNNPRRCVAYKEINEEDIQWELISFI